MTHRGLRVAHVATIDSTLYSLLLPQLRALGDEGYTVTAVSAPGPFVGRLEAQGIRHLSWPHATRAWDPAADARAYASLAELLRRERFKLVHTHNPKPGVLGRIGARRTGVPAVVNTVHGLYATKDDPAWRRALVLAAERLAARYSDLELYQSGEDLAWARELGVVDPPRAVLLGNGIDLARFRPDAVPPDRVRAVRGELGFDEGDVVVGTVGRLVAEKGYRDLALAADRVRRADPRVRFLAVGPDDTSKWDALHGWELPGDVLTSTGWRDDVRDLLAAMDVFVLPSWREGLPRSAVEAAAMGRPMVLTDIRGSREVARDQREALMVPRGAPALLAEAILRLVTDDDLRVRLGDAARVRALERFDERRVHDVLLAEYRRLLERKGLVGHPVTLEGFGRVTIRAARPGEAGWMADLHARTHPQAFLPSLGRRFLELLYRAHIEEPVAVALVAEQDGRPIGYTTGLLSTARFRRRFALRHGLGAALAAAPALTRPGVLRGMMDLAGYPEKVGDLPQAEWTFIALDPDVRARGLGTLLGRSVLRALATQGADRVKTFVAADNEPSNRMVLRLGFEPRGNLSIHDGVPSNLYVLTCPSS